MVDYRGPSAFRPLVDAFGITAFDRITDLKYRPPYGTGARIDSEAVAQIEHLERISVVGAPGVRLAEEFKLSVPACRLEDVTSTESSATATLSTEAMAFGCADGS